MSDADEKAHIQVLKQKQMPSVPVPSNLQISYHMGLWMWYTINDKGSTWVGNTMVEGRMLPLVLNKNNNGRA